MGDELDISGSGSTSVATHELYAAARQLAQLAAEASAITAQLSLIDDIVTLRSLEIAGAPAQAARAELDIDQAQIVLGEIQAQARVLEWALNSAADGYGFVELFLRNMLGGVLGTVAHGVGSFGTRLLPMAAPALGAAALAGVDGQDVSTALSTAGAVDAVRTGTMLADDAAMGALGVPWPLAHVLGDEGLGVTGLPFAASLAMIGASGFGALREGPVALASTRVVSVTGPPSGFAQRLERVPDPGSNGGAQVIIEKYEAPGVEDRFEVYIAGTVTFDPVADDEPWDMTSNLANAVGPGSGSYDSVAKAMELAGIDASSPVQFTGYSQGGGTAAQLAASGDYNTVGLVTFGGPTGQVALPESIPTVLVEHRDDLVPALGGTQENLHAVIVERDVFEGRGIPQDKLIPAHHRACYQDTAVLMDASADASLTAALARIDAFGTAPGATVTSTAYRFVRTSSAASAPGEG